MIGVRVLRVGDEEHLGLVRADGARDCVPGFDGVLDETVRKIKAHPAHRQAARESRGIGGEQPCGLGGLAGAGLTVSVRRRLAVGHVEDEHVVALRGEARDRRAHAEFGVVGVRGDDENVGHGAAPRGSGCQFCPPTTTRP